MTAVFNVVASDKKLARVYFELDPSSKLFAASILYIEGELDHKVSKTLDDVQTQVKTTLDKRFGPGKYFLEPSAPVEREEYEKKFYEFMVPRTF